MVTIAANAASFTRKKRTSQPYKSNERITRSKTPKALSTMGSFPKIASAAALRSTNSGGTGQ